MPQQRLSFAQWSQRRGSSISGDLLEFSSQQSDDLDVSQKSKCLSSRPRTVSTTSSTKPRTSWVFSHMPDEEGVLQLLQNISWTLLLTVTACQKEPREQRKVTTIRTIIEQARVAAEENPRKRRRLNDQSGDSIEPDQLEALYVRFITACSLPFRLVECPEFRALLAYINNDIETWLPDTHDTVKTWIMRQYECQKERKLELDDPGVHNVTLKHIEAWRNKGPLGKIHNFVVFIQRSVQRSQKFLTISHNRKLARDNDTRWSSWYNMLRVALNLRDAIDGYFNKWMELDCAGDELSSEDWIILEKIKSFLEKLKMTTKALESSFATLDNVLLAMDFVLAQFEAGKEAYIDDPIMAPMYNSGWAKLDKYYRLTDESPAYVAAIVLHPSHKWHYIQENWKKEWVESSKKLMETLWNDYKPVESPLPLCEVPSTTTNEFLNWRNKHLQPSLVTDEYERYCNSERVYGFTSALAWWLEETQQKNYPNLSKMAVDILSIPAMSAEPERLFSGAKITITDRRNRLGSDVVEALECLKSWFGIRELQGDVL
ncbi:HAT, C-terminal dimerization domain [Fusarium oxysporum f. sp. vasinfectum]|nr:HAT, C-terminal dimerization domain [Fusarium oxysporum f. sp. vasinfectum]KAK2926832.1 HAT, C-terminal dimerization domain [Fusarium oxysporum f. sp. vasinfectum]